jgi:hypothetical protein
MQYFESPLSPQTIYALAWTLVHSLWQLSLLFFLYKFIGSFYRQNASVRYWTGIGVLFCNSWFLVSLFGRLFQKMRQPKYSISRYKILQSLTNVSTSEPINQAPLAIEFCLGTNGYLA